MPRQAAAGRPGRRGQPQAQAAPPAEAPQKARCCTAGSCGGGGRDALHSEVLAHEISARHRHGTRSEAAWAWRCTGAPGTGQRCTGRCAAPDSCASKGTPGSGTPAACRESHSGRTEGTAAGHCALAPGVVGSATRRHSAAKYALCRILHSRMRPLHKYGFPGDGDRISRPREDAVASGA